MSPKIAGALVGFFILVLIARQSFEPETADPNSGPISVNWTLLYKLDYETGKAPDDLKKLHGKRVRIPGYVVPLSDNFRILQDFLLVPDAQSCVHVPPPPPNLIVQSKMIQPIPSERVYNPAWITGILRIEKAESKYGSAGFQMDVEKLEKYVY